MKKLFLFSVLVFLWNCGANSKENSSVVSNGTIQALPKKLESSNPPVFYIAGFEDLVGEYNKKNMNGDGVIESVHKITEDEFDRSIAAYHPYNLYNVQSIINSQQFKDTLAKAGDNDYIKITFPEDYDADNFTYSIASKFEFGNCKSLYSKQLLTKIFDLPNKLDVIITKGKERVLDNPQYNIKRGDYVEALFAIKLNERDETGENKYIYYNLSHDPTKPYK
ncbi:hypothetical protein H9Q08_19810 [Chryseobacterium sp. PS-8]|uniref:Lipoprotein n=1 Tax=Chryseobacterium indicum TaxID=2766954 RepID=A0ABS9CAS1_9FLAO|nr:hypothetical protein [Chryseobacterium sp. PS-8]MCF2221516.1 hypothetical protein [Chryseobacterium sp. PS-8]